MGLNPSTIYWLDIFSHLLVVKIVMFVRHSCGVQGARWGLFFGGIEPFLIKRSHLKSNSKNFL